MFAGAAAVAIAGYSRHRSHHEWRSHEDLLLLSAASLQDEKLVIRMQEMPKKPI
jgi:hypothetical protein